MHDAAYFDQWYSDMAVSTVRDGIVARAMGMPDEVRFVGTLPWQGVAEVAAELRLPPDGLLLDVGCGGGGYGIEIARRAGARLAGVDFSAVAVAQAGSLAADRLPAGRFEFRVGMLVASGLPTAVADALICVDAVQFAEPPLAALREFRRLLAPGGRVAVTCWEAVDPGDRRVPSRVRAVDLRRDLPAAGFAEVAVRQMPAWRQAERRLWEEAVQVDSPDPAIRSLRAEGRSSLDAFDSLHRVFATATAP